jgi:hypothetical protein
MVYRNLNMIFTVEPSEFFVNPDTTDNFFQNRSDGTLGPSDAIRINESALSEHRSLRRQLSNAGIITASIKGPIGRPDAIFPNNSFSIHERNQSPLVILYPMSPGRQRELPDDFIDFLKAISGDQFYDLRHFEEENKFLEGTGVLNFSEDEKSVYMGRSERASEEVLKEVIQILEIAEQNTFVFDMFDEQGRKIYHTNVIAWVGREIFAICLESIPDGAEKEKLLQKVASDRLVLLNLSFHEVNQFSGNALEIVNTEGQPYLTISKTGYNAFTPLNRAIIDQYYQGRVITIDADTIQQYGGGSVRCMEAKASLSPILLNEVAGELKRAYSHLLLDNLKTIPEGIPSVASNVALLREANYE